MIYNTHMPSGDFGMELAIDLHHCGSDKMTISSLLDFLKQLLVISDMTAHGDPVIWDARESDELHIKGYSIIQLIKTSSIVIHTMDKTNLICINLFSCKPFDPESIVAFAKEFFQCSETSSSVIQRGLSSK